MTHQCVYVKGDGTQCKLRTHSPTVCHMHTRLYAAQLEREAETKKITDELIQLKKYEQNVKTEIKHLIEKRSKINSLKNELDSYKEEVSKLEKRNNQLEEENETLAARCNKFEWIQKENEKLKAITENWDNVYKFEKMKGQIMELTNSQRFDIDEVATNEEYRSKLYKLFGCSGNDLKRQYWHLQAIRNSLCHPYRNTLPVK